MVQQNLVFKYTSQDLTLHLINLLNIGEIDFVGIGPPTCDVGPILLLIYLYILEFGVWSLEFTRNPMCYDILIIWERESYMGWE